MKKRKKKHWTTKNTHACNKKRKLDDEYWTPKKTKEEWTYEQIACWIAIICALLLIVLKVCDNNIVGYDYFPSIPSEWIKWVK